MQPCASTIQRLPQHVVERSRSATQIVDLPSAVSELVLNSIQAGSKSIQVVVNVSQWSASVDDDGCGISAKSMQLLGQRFCSSSSTGRGEALSSLAQVSELQITSRAAGNFETYTKTISCQQNSQVASGRIALCIIPRQRCGTSVSLARFLHNQPVRLKQSKGHAATLEGVKTALHTLLLPYPIVELTLRQEGSSNPILHMHKDRSLSEALQQYFSQHVDYLHITTSQHRQGWQLSGAAVAPRATLNTTEQQLLYVNNQQVTCAALTQLLRDWYLKSLRTLQASDHNSSGTRMAARTPEPGYVLLLSCPAAAVNVLGRVAGKHEVEFSSSMGQLCAVLQEGLGAVWGSMPSVWVALASKGNSRDQKAGAGTANTATAHAPASGKQTVVGSKRRNFTQAAQHEQQGEQQKQQVVLPVHGLQMSSKTRSLAGMQATQNPPGPAQDPALMLAGSQQASRHQQHQQLDAAGMFDSDLTAALADDDLDMLVTVTARGATSTAEAEAAAAAINRCGSTHSFWGHDTTTGYLDGLQDRDICSGRSKQSAAAALAGIEDFELGNGKGSAADREWLGSGRGGGFGSGRQHRTSAAVALGSSGRSGAAGSGALAVDKAAVGAGQGSSRSRGKGLRAAAADADAAADLLGLGAATTHTNAAWLDGISVLRASSSPKPPQHDLKAAARSNLAADDLYSAAVWDDGLLDPSSRSHTQGRKYSRSEAAAAAAAAGAHVLDVQADLGILDVSPLPGTSGRQLQQQHEHWLQQDSGLLAADWHVGGTTSQGAGCPAHRDAPGTLTACGLDPLALSPLHDTAARQLQWRKHAAQAEDHDFDSMLEFSVSPLINCSCPRMRDDGSRSLGQQQQQQQSCAAATENDGLGSAFILGFATSPLGDDEQQEPCVAPAGGHGLASAFMSDFEVSPLEGVPHSSKHLTKRQQQPSCVHTPAADGLWLGSAFMLDNFNEQENQRLADVNHADHGQVSDCPGAATALLDSISPLPGSWATNAAELGIGLNYDYHQKQHRNHRVQEDVPGADEYLQLRQQQQTSLTDEDLLPSPLLWQSTASVQQPPHQPGSPYSSASNLLSSSMPALQQQQEQEQADEPLASPQPWQCGPWHRSTARASQEPLSPSLGGFMGTLQLMLDDPVDLAVTAVAAGIDDGAEVVRQYRVRDREATRAALPGHNALLAPGAAAGRSPAAQMVDELAAAAPADSEETVQQHRRQQQQVDSRPPSTAGLQQPMKQQSNKATAQAAPAGRLLLLPMFQKRLVHSAPPMAKQKRTFARSGCCLLGCNSSSGVSGVRSSSSCSGGSSSRVAKRLASVLEEADAARASSVAVPDPAAQPAPLPSPNAAGIGTTAADAAGTAAAAGARKRRTTCPAAVNVVPQQSAQHQAVTAAAACSSQHAQQKQQTTATGSRAALTDISNTAAKHTSIHDKQQQQQRRQAEPELKSSCTGDGPQQHKQLKQAKLPFVVLPGIKLSKPKEAAAAAKVPDTPWYKKKLQQQQDAASKTPATAVATAVDDGSNASELVSLAAAGPEPPAPAAAQQGAALQKPSRQSAMKRAEFTAAQQQVQASALAADADRPRKRVRFAETPQSQGARQLPVKTEPKQQQRTDATADKAFTAAAGAANNNAVAGTAVDAPLDAGGKQQNSNGSTTASTRPSSSSSKALVVACQPAILSVEDLERSSTGSGRKAVQQLCQLVPESVTRQQLQQAEILSQVANKIIVVRCGSVLLAVDQHAADERVQLEILQQQLTEQQQQEHTAATNPSSKAGSSCSPGSLLQLQILRPAQQTMLNMAEARAVAMYQQQVQHWGWELRLAGNGMAAAGATAVSSGVDTAAVLQQVPVLAGVQLGSLDLKLYLHQLLETAGSLSQPPPGVVRTLKSKACRSAIMFGDELTQQQAVQLVAKLGKTQLCFCCAHGRPTTVPLLDAAAMRNRLEQQASAKSLGQQAAVAAAGAGGKAAKQQDKTQGLSAALRRRLGTLQ